ncbi:MAG: transposase [Candidatus Aminicenantes bacterium]|nr:transposase [Candidatus Aminicenantes bacterium]
MSPYFQSENLEIRRAIHKVSKATEKKGIWVIDRGGDRNYIFDYMLNNYLSFLIRLKKTRDLIYRGGEHLVLELALTCPLPYAERVVKQEKGKETIYDLQFGSRPVKLPGKKEPLTLVVVRGYGKEPIMLLTDLRVTKSRKSIWGIVESYLTRWSIEETIRFLKQSYKVEDIRLLTYHRLQNMMAILTAVAYFVMVYLGLRTKLRVLARHVMIASRRLFGIPDFHFYALADGIREYLFGRQKGLQRFHHQWLEENKQLSLFDL